MIATKKIGNQGEQIVSSWLAEKGYVILANNFRSRLGEIDVVAAKDDVLAFVEVKTRNTKYFSIASTVVKSKQVKIAKTAKLFILQNNIVDKVLRFDVATIEVVNGTHTIEYIPNAFQADHF